MANNESLELPEYDAKQGVTSGIMELDDGTNIFITSGNKDPRYINYANDGHVEQKAALIMRDNNISNATLRHNNSNGTCGWCNTMTETFLPENATLKVIPPYNAIANNSKSITAQRIYQGNKKTPKLSKRY